MLAAPLDFLVVTTLQFDAFLANIGQKKTSLVDFL